MGRYLSSSVQWTTLHRILPLLFYLAAIALTTPHSLSIPLRLSFILYALFVFWVVWKNVISNREIINPTSTASSQKFFFYLLIFSMVFLIISRLYLFIRHGEAPLGYDTGFYLKFVGPGGFANPPLPTFLHWAALYSLDFSPVTILHGMYVLIQFLIAGALYSLARTLTNSSHLALGAILVLLFACSLTQFSAFWWMFYQTMLAIALLLFTITLIYRGSWLAIFTGSFGIGIHPITFAPLGIAIILFVLIQGTRSLIHRQWTDPETKTIIITSGLMTGLAILLRGPALFKEGIAYLTNHQFLISNFPLYEQPQAAGLFLDFSWFHLTLFYIIPFTILGFFLFFLRMGLFRNDQKNVIVPRHLLLFLFFSTLFTLAYFPFIYHHRFQIYLDLVIIIFAAYPMLIFLEYFWQERLGRVVAILLVSGLVLNTSLITLTQEPALFPDELENIKAIAKLAEPQAYAMSTDGRYTPWVYGFSDRETIAPGYLYWDRWNLTQWNEFWNGKSSTRKHELLKYYNRPLYLFVGKRQGQDLAFQKFIRQDSHFQQINSQVWRYDPMSITKEEIINLKLQGTN